MADISNIINYYVNLLIIQYHDKPKAKATIELLVNQLLANGIVLDIRDGYNIDTAVGDQLDILGKYIGVDRMYKDNDLTDMFSLVSYDEAIPDEEDRWGFVTYENYDDVNENGVLNYYSVLSKNFFLTDDAYRQIIKLKIIHNNINHSHKTIDDGLYAIFEDTLTADTTLNMDMILFITSQLTQVITAAIQKDVIPRPMGVQLTEMIQSDTPFFGFTDYAGRVGSHVTGFAIYDDFETKQGNTLTYNKITEI